jgi:hypothetical protein
MGVNRESKATSYRPTLIQIEHLRARSKGEFEVTLSLLKHSHTKHQPAWVPVRIFGTAMQLHFSIDPDPQFLKAMIFPASPIMRL